MRQIFEHESIIAAPAQKVFSFHERPDALRLLIPPWQPIQVLQQVGGIQNGPNPATAIEADPSSSRRDPQGASVRQIFEHESIIAAPAQKVFSFHERPDALRLLIPHLAANPGFAASRWDPKWGKSGAQDGLRPFLDPMGRLPSGLCIRRSIRRCTRRGAVPILETHPFCNGA